MPPRGPQGPYKNTIGASQRRRSVCVFGSIQVSESIFIYFWVSSQVDYLSIQVKSGFPVSNWGKRVFCLRGALFRRKQSRKFCQIRLKFRENFTVWSFCLNFDNYRKNFAKYREMCLTFRKSLQISRNFSFQRTISQIKSRNKRPGQLAMRSGSIGYLCLSAYWYRMLPIYRCSNAEEKTRNDTKRIGTRKRNRLIFRNGLSKTSA